MHVISIGDSPVEQMAIQEVLWCCYKEQESYCKTLRLTSDPSVEHLSGELQVLSFCIAKLASLKGDVDLNLE
eukprot:CAMPEP_0197670506 /NCGR_PEP_ID=MMETSP1338-20131121/74731_1 /TAXON_ID=43686 ORGANISM="Pelagodinium beii, Strain RCC1491" /NCGR_SAMPLE_ID=MMETSP1338 /ASSEMBLY_ACC=CAM_ASM_000754 /LENGTH=71 /DNA_ID=CAMNT_0043250251 /DNA_START=3 /DNA_END=215 /DNA_ORIENTATION=-